VSRELNTEETRIRPVEKKMGEKNMEETLVRSIFLSTIFLSIACFCMFLSPHFSVEYKLATASLTLRVTIIQNSPNRRIPNRILSSSCLNPDRSLTEG
jgi:hypothetical protein